MNNMYDILAKFNSAAGPAKTTLTENVDPVAFAALAPPKDKITFADKIAGAKKEVDEMLGDVAAEAMKKAVVGLKNEADMEEGNDFTGARLAAIKAGKPTFSVGGKTFKVTGDTGDERKQVDELSPGTVRSYAGKAIDARHKSNTRRIRASQMAHGGDDNDQAHADAIWDKETKNIEKRTAGLKRAGARLTNKDVKKVNELDVNLIKAAQKHAKEHPAKKDPESERNIHKKYGSRTDRDDNDGDDDDYDEWGNEKRAKKAKGKAEGPKKKGRPAGTGRSIGAKGPTGKSKLLSKGAIKEEGDEDDDVKVAMALLKKHGYKVSKDLEEKAVSKAQQRFMGMVHAAQKGEKPASKEVAKVAKEMPKKSAKDYAKTKHAGLPEKVKSKKEESKEEVEETTVAGSVATAPAAEAPKAKGKKGAIQFGKGVYESKLEESYKSRLEKMLTEGISINASQGEDGKKTLNVNATDEDAIKLAQILQLAGMPQGHDYHDACPGCGQSPCGCEQVDEELANAPDPVYANTEMINTQGEDLHKPKSTGQTTVPVLNKDAARQGVAHQVEKIREETEGRLWKLYQRYEAK